MGVVECHRHCSKSVDWTVRANLDVPHRELDAACVVHV